MIESEKRKDHWILIRKRVQAIVEEKKKSEGIHRENRVAVKFHSRRGCYNTITFSDIDRVPPLLKKDGASKKRTRNEICEITGLRTRYRDSLNGRPYYDKHAIRELRKRYGYRDSLKRRKEGIRILESVVNPVEKPYTDNLNLVAQTLMLVNF